MANTDSAMGFRAIDNGIAGSSPRITRYVRSTTGAIGEGAMMTLDDSGPIVSVGTTHDDLSPGGNFLGALAAYVGADDTEMWIYDDPKQEYLVQGDSAVATPISALGKYCSCLNLTTHNATTLQSKAELDSSELTATAAAGDIVQVRRLWDAEDNDQDAANAKWVVVIRPTSHVWGASVGTRLT